MNIETVSAGLPASLPGQGPQSVLRGESAPPATKTNAAERTTAVTAPQPATRSQVEDAVKSVRDFIAPTNSDLQFNIDQDTGATVVKVIDRSTQEVLRQIPSEEMLSIAKTLDDIKGLFVHQKA